MKGMDMSLPCICCREAKMGVSCYCREDLIENSIKPACKKYPISGQDLLTRLKVKN